MQPQKNLSVNGNHRRWGCKCSSVQPVINRHLGESCEIYGVVQRNGVYNLHDRRRRLDAKMSQNHRLARQNMKRQPLGQIGSRRHSQIMRVQNLARLYYLNQQWPGDCSVSNLQSPGKTMHSLCPERQNRRRLRVRIVTLEFISVRHRLQYNYLLWQWPCWNGLPMVCFAQDYASLLPHNWPGPNHRMPTNPSKMLTSMQMDCGSSRQIAARWMKMTRCHERIEQSRVL